LEGSEQPVRITDSGTGILKMYLYYDLSHRHINMQFSHGAVLDGPMAVL